ncbi:hypothetical protein ACFPT7_05590 [Acidicapsa dinghuensis]|uniref:Uncharacterized protein n=1 Tax=Acidicapsa dinghuensis TaxID=2218256 RepID=A0ABW1EBS5_9BACT|nr:hypothetical protein [Acidicapsa dinghuensis]
MNGFADVLVLPGVRVAADEDTHEPSAGPATNNLARFADHIPSKDVKCGARVAHVAAV